MTEALILAAGRGERLRPVTDTTPKPLLRIGKDTLIERHLRALAAAGIVRVVINLGWLGEQIVDYVGDGRRFGVDVIYSPEGYPTLDTGGAIKRALGVMTRAPFWVVNADVVCEHSYATRPDVLLDGCQAAVGLTANPDYRDDDGDFVLRDARALNSGGDRMTFSGISCYAPAFFDDVDDGRFSIVPMLRRAAAGGALAGFSLQGHWFDVGTLERLTTVRAAVTD